MVTLTMRNFLVPYTVNGKKQQGQISVNTREVVGILVVTSEFAPPMFFLRKKDNGLEQVILWPCSGEATGQLLQGGIDCEYHSHIVSSDRKIPHWLKMVSFNLESDCHYYDLT